MVASSLIGRFSSTVSPFTPQLTTLRASVYHTLFIIYIIFSLQRYTLSSKPPNFPLKFYFQLLFPETHLWGEFVLYCARFSVTLEEFAGFLYIKAMQRIEKFWGYDLETVLFSRISRLLGMMRLLRVR